MKGASWAWGDFPRSISLLCALQAHVDCRPDGISAAPSG